MAWYRSGTVTVSNGSNVVTGTGTQWAGNVNVGDTIVLGSPPQLYEVANVASNTTIALVTNYSGTSGSGQSYFIAPTQGWIKELADRAAAVIATYASIEQALDDLEQLTALISQADAQAGTRTDVQGWSAERVRQAIQSPLEAGSFSIPISSISQYDTGLFTPTVVGTITAGSAASYSIRTGEFEKIGDTVTFTLTVAWVGHTGTGGVAITGLPYVPSARVALCSIKDASKFIGYVLQPALFESTPFVSVLGYNMAGSSDIPPMEESATLTISGSYGV